VTSTGSTSSDLLHHVELWVPDLARPSGPGAGCSPRSARSPPSRGRTAGPGARAASTSSSSGHPTSSGTSTSDAVPGWTTWRSTPAAPPTSTPSSPTRPPTAGSCPTRFGPVQRLAPSLRGV